MPQEDLNLCSPSRRRKRRRRSNDIAAAAAVHDDCTSHANYKTIEELFKAYQAEVKIKEQVQEELKISKKQLANLERAIYPRRTLAIMASVAHLHLNMEPICSARKNLHKCLFRLRIHTGMAQYAPYIAFRI